MALGVGDPPPPGAESAAGFLARTPLFSGVDPELVERLAATSRTRRLGAGKWLFREHDPAEEMYVVRAGRLEVVDEIADGEHLPISAYSTS
jgi:CRP-like cAMP-binding protein